MGLIPTWKRILPFHRALPSSEARTRVMACKTPAAAAQHPATLRKAAASGPSARYPRTELFGLRLPTGTVPTSYSAKAESGWQPSVFAEVSSSSSSPAAPRPWGGTARCSPGPGPHCAPPQPRPGAELSPRRGGGERTHLPLATFYARPPETSPLLVRRQCGSFSHP